MLTYSVTSPGMPKKDWSELTTGEKVTGIVTLLLVLCLIIGAWMRAIHCSSPNPDSRAIHLLFATVDPVLYLLFSAFPDIGLCR